MCAPDLTEQTGPGSGNALGPHSVLALAALIVCFALAGSVASPIRAALVINEVLYDPAGPDAGAEWVEIMNTGPVAVPLQGIRLEAGDGSASGRWALFWEGRAGSWIEPGGSFVVGGPYRGREAHAPGLCGLQNGPDAVRLILDGLQLDRVGWGEHTLHEYFEGHPSPLAPSGESLARHRDGYDSDDNLADFAPADPTPGLLNVPPRDLAVHWRAGRLLPLEERLQEVEASLVLHNHGTEPCSLQGVRLYADSRSVLPAPEFRAATLPAGDSLCFLTTLPVRSNRSLQEWIGRVVFDGDDARANDVDTLRRWAGEPPASFSEVSPHPGGDACEWFELRGRSLDGWQPAGWSIEDASGLSVTISLQDAVEEGRFVVMAKDSTAVGRRGNAAPTAETVRFLRWEGRWPTLNDTAGEDGAADTLFLRDPRGVIADWAAWGDTEVDEVWVRLQGIPGGAGLDAWTIAGGADAATPGSAPESGSGRPALSSPEEHELAPAGVSFERNPEGVWVRLPDGPRGASWRVRVCDLRGQELWRRTGRRGVTGGTIVRWDGRTSRGELCSAGVVVVEAVLVGDEGERRVARETMVIGR